MSILVLVSRVKHQRISYYQHTLDDQVWSKNTHRGDTDAGLSSTVCGTKTCEDDGRCAAHCSKERLFMRISKVLVLEAKVEAQFRELDATSWNVFRIVETTNRIDRAIGRSESADVD